MLEKTEGGFLIAQIRQVGGRIFERLLNRAGIDAFNGAQGRILYILWQTDKVPIAVLGKKTGLAKSTLTGMLARMEEAQLLTRSPDAEDGRQILIRLTEKTRAMHDEYNEISRKMNEIYYEGLSDAQILLFEDLLRHVLGNLRTHEENTEAERSHL